MNLSNEPFLWTFLMNLSIATLHSTVGLKSKCPHLYVVQRRVLVWISVVAPASQMTLKSLYRSSFLLIRFGRNVLAIARYFNEETDSSHYAVEHFLHQWNYAEDQAKRNTLLLVRRKSSYSGSAVIALPVLGRKLGYFCLIWFTFADAPHSLYKSCARVK